MARPTEGIAEFGVRGIESGMDYARTKRQLEFQQEQLQMAKERHQQTMDQNKVAYATKTLETLNQVMNLPSKVGKGVYKNLKKQLGAQGAFLDDEMEAALFDPEFKDTASEAISYLMASVTGPDGPRIWDTVIDGVGRAGAVKMFQDAVAFGKQTRILEEQQSGVQKLQKIKEAATTERERLKLTEAEKKEKTKNIKDLSSVAQKIAKESINSMRAGEIILNIKDNTGASDFQMLKAFNQFNDTARVTEGEIAGIKGGQALLDRLVQISKNATEGTIISQQLRDSIRQTTKQIMAIIRKRQQDDLQPVVNEANRLNVPMNSILTSQQLKDLNLISKAKQRKSVSPGISFPENIQGMIRNAEATRGKPFSPAELRKIHTNLKRQGKL